MNKTKVKNLLSLVLVLVLVLALTIAAVACDKTTPDDDDNDNKNDSSETTADTGLIKNGTFSTYTGTTAPYTAGTWTVSSSGDSSNTSAGVIHVDELYETESALKSWASIANPGKANEDDSDSAVFMVYNEKENVYTVKNTFTTAIGTYYRVSVNYRLVGITNGSAYVKFGSSVNKSFKLAQSDDSGWQKIELYLETSQTETKSVSISLVLGDTENKAVGAVFFDNAKTEKITKSEYTNAQVDGVYSDTYSMRDPDGSFINNASESNPATPNTWDGSIGKNADGTSAVSTYMKHGVVDVNSFSDWKSQVGNSDDEELVSPKTPYQYLKDNDLSGYENLPSDSKILMISNASGKSKVSNTDDAYSSYKFTSNTSLVAELGTYYKISVWVYTDVEGFKYASDNSEEDRDAVGAWIKIGGIEDAAFANINTEKKWQEYTIYLFSHEFRSKDYSIVLSLGDGGKGDSTLACGTIYFDALSIERVGTFDSSNKASIIDGLKSQAEYNSLYNSIVEMSTIANSDSANINLNEGNYETAVDNDVKANVSIDATDSVETIKNSDVLFRHFDIDEVENSVVGTTDEEIAQWWKDNYGLSESPKAPYDFKDLVMINNLTPTAYNLTVNGNMHINKNSHYRVAIWLKTVGIATDTGATIALNYEDGTSLASFTKVNTSAYENEDTNNYAEYVFYIQGSNLVSLNPADDDKIVNLKISMGSGNQYSTSSFLKGAIIIANVNFEQIEYSEYDDATTGTYVKKNSLTESKGTISNGSFNGFTYDSDKIDSTTGLQTDYLKPSNWTLNSSADDSIESGIVNINATEFIKNKFGEDYQIYNKWATGHENAKEVSFGAPNVLAVNLPEAVKSQLLYSSSSVSLSTNSYYIIKAYVRVIGDMKGEIHLTTTNNTEPVVASLSSIDGDDGWQEIVLVARTGAFSSASATLKIYVGEYSLEHDKDDDTQAKYSGTMFLDSFTYYTIDKAKYEELAASDNIHNANFNIEEFYTTNDTEKVTAPSKWTGSGAKSSSSIATTENVQYAGIFTKGYSNVDNLKLVEEKTVTDEEGNETTEYETIEGSTLTKDYIFDSKGMNNGLETSDSLLLINNQVESYYQYKNTSSITLDKNSYYILTVYVRTYGIAEGKNAIVRVSTGTDSVVYETPVNTEYVPVREDGKLTYVTNEDGTKSVKKEKTTDNQWQQINFYFKTAESSSTSSVYVYLILGESDEKVQGYAFFDNLSLTKYTDETEFNEAYAQRYQVDENGKALVGEDGKYLDAENADEFLLNNRIIRADDVDDAADDNDDDDTDDEEEKKGNDLLWLYITSIVIAALLIIAIVVVLLRKYIPKKWFKRKKAVDYARPEEEKAKGAKEDKSDKDEFKD